MKRPAVVIFIGARPNVPKAWTLLRALNTLESQAPEYSPAITLIHSGQHYHELMGESFAGQFGITVQRNLDVGSQHSDIEQVATLLVSVNRVLLDLKPDCVVAIGDVNTALAVALSASRLGMPVVHLEAGLRSGDWDPEEINRRTITACALYHLAPSHLAVRNLLQEGIEPEKIYLVGNTMAETFLRHASERQASTILETLGLQPGTYILFTVHKASNLSQLSLITELLAALAREAPVIFPCHPHTLKVLQHHFHAWTREQSEIRVLPPLPYHDMGRLMEASSITVTDSAGLQEECTMAGVPCLTIGWGTARPETIVAGSNQVIGYDIARCLELIQRPRQPVEPPACWDELVSQRLRDAFVEILADIQHHDARMAWKLRPADCP